MKNILSRLRGENGNAMMEFTALGITLLIPLVYVMLAVFDVQRGMYGVAAAAREASRAYTLGSSVGDAEARANAAATTALADQKIAIGDAHVKFVCDGQCLQAGSAVEVTVTYNVPLPFIPQMMGGPMASIKVESDHRTPYGQYRQNAG